MSSIEQPMHELRTPNGNIYGTRAESKGAALEQPERRFPHHSASEFEYLGVTSDGC